MLKYIVVAVFSVCALPCFVTAQDCGCGSSVVMEAPVADCGCGGDVVMEAAADCGCGAPAACAPRSRKKLALTSVSKERCRLKLACSTDSCGCPTKKLVREKVAVSRKRLTLVDAPARERCGCAGGRVAGRLKGLLSSIGNIGSCGGGCDAAPASGCGCEAAAPVADCGCGSAPVVEAAPCGCGS